MVTGAYGSLAQGYPQQLQQRGQQQKRHLLITSEPSRPSSTSNMPMKPMNQASSATSQQSSKIQPERMTAARFVEQLRVDKDLAETYAYKIQLWLLTHRLEVALQKLGGQKRAKHWTPEICSPAFRGGSELQKALERDYDLWREAAHEYGKGLDRIVKALESGIAADPSRQSSQVATTRLKTKNFVRKHTVVTRLMPRWTVEQYLEAIDRHLQQWDDILFSLYDDRCFFPLLKQLASAEYHDYQGVRGAVRYLSDDEHVFLVSAKNALCLASSHRGWSLETATSDALARIREDRRSQGLPVTGQAKNRFPRELHSAVSDPVRKLIKDVQRAKNAYDMQMKAHNETREFKKTMQGQAWHTGDPRRRVVWCNVNFDSLHGYLERYLGLFPAQA